MKNLWWLLLLMVVGACGKKPLQYTNMHFLTLADSNEGKALPLHVIPVNQELFIKVSNVKPEEWFVHELVDTTPGIQKRVFRGSGSNIVRVERIDEKNDFLVITDFGNSDSVEAQRIYVGERFWRAKDVYLLVTRDRVRVIDKDTYEKHLTSQ